jgi:hypothetical protein
MARRQFARAQGIPGSRAESVETGVRLPAQRDGSRTTTSEPGLLAALLAHAVVRLLTLTVLYVASLVTERSAYHSLTRWDAAWYRRIAEHGYGHGHIAADGRHLTDYVFFPLYPAVERVLSGATDMPVAHSGLVLSAVASLVAAAGIYRVGEHLHGARVGFVLVCLWSSLPVSMVQSMAYSESLFTALVAWSLYALLVRRYLAAGALAMLAGLTRPLGVALVAAVMVSALAWLVQERGRGPVPGGSLPRQRAAIGALLAPLGLLAYVGYVGWAERRPLGYLDAAERWGNGVDGGRRFLTWTLALLGSTRMLVGVAVVLGLVLLGAAAWKTRPSRYPVGIFVFTASAVLLSLCTAGYFGSRPRYLLPVFTLLLWPAVAAARLTSPRLALVLTILATASAGYGAIWLLGAGPP